jgi:hypothetical protein
MKLRPVVLTTVILFAGAALPARSSAQRSIAPFVGREFDEQSNWIFLGGEAWLGLPTSAWSINPRFTYHSLGAGSTGLQLDANAVYEFKPASGSVTPFAGAGLGWIHTSGGGTSDSKVGGTFVAGIRLHLAGNDKLEPYLNTEYTYAKQFTNTYQMLVGLIFRMK